MITEIEGIRCRPPAKSLSDGMKATESATTGERAPGKRAARPQSSQADKSHNGRLAG